MFDLTLKPYKMDLTGRGFKLYFNDPLPKDFDSWFILCELPGNSSSINAASHNRMYCDEYHTYFYLGRTAMMVVIHHHKKDFNPNHERCLQPEGLHLFKKHVNNITFSMMPLCIIRRRLILDVHGYGYTSPFFKGAPTISLAEVNPLFQQSEGRVYRQIHFYSDDEISDNLHDISKQQLLNLIWSKHINFVPDMYRY